MYLTYILFDLIIEDIYVRKGAILKLKPITLKEKAYEELKNMIINGKLKPGEFLTERILVDRLEMSRTPIRSALEILEVEGFIKKSPKQGIMVESMSLDKAMNIYDLRTAIESHVVRNLASEVLSENEIQLITENLMFQKEYVDKLDYDNFSKLDFNFHLLLAKMYQNDEIIHILEQTGDKLRQIAVTVMKKNTSRIQFAYEEHVRIFEYIKTGNQEEAIKEIIDHFVVGKTILLS